MTAKRKARRETEEQLGLIDPGPTVANIDDADVLASLSAFARAFGTDRETLRRCLLEQGSAEPVAVRSGAKLYALRTVYLAFTADAGETDPDRLTAFKRKAWFQGTREKVALQRELGELVDALDMERTLGRALQTVNRYLETILDVIERDVGLSPEQATAAERHLDELREEMHKAVVEETAAEQDADDVMAEDPDADAPADPAPAAEKPAGPVTGAVDMAAEWLLELLQAGPIGAADVLEQAKAAGMSEATVRRARKQLGKGRIETKRQGRGWVWELA